jgi:hypothetical protein
MMGRSRGGTKPASVVVKITNSAAQKKGACHALFTRTGIVTGRAVGKARSSGSRGGLGSFTVACPLECGRASDCLVSQALSGAMGMVESMLIPIRPLVKRGFGDNW